MLSLTMDDGPHDCEGIRRRDWLRIGSLALGGLALPGLLAARARAAKAGLAETVKDRAVVVLFLSGGPSHIETFDPRMDTPEGVRSVTGEVATTLPGVTFGGTFPGLAARCDKMAVVRSFHHPVNDHVQAIRHVLTAGNPLGAGMGALYARLRGANDAQTAMPTTGLVTAREVDPQYKNERTRVQNASGPGSLGSAYAPFDPAAGGGSLDLMRLRLPRQRLEDRRALLSTLDRARRAFDEQGTAETLGHYEQQAFDLILRDAGAALDLKREDPRVVDRYDTSGYQVGHKEKRPCTLGRQLLMVRRLVELGCGFVTVHNAGWDMHADVNNPGIEAGMAHARQSRGPRCLGVFGRPRGPRAERTGAADHHRRLRPYTSGEQARRTRSLGLTLNPGSGWRRTANGSGDRPILARCGHPGKRPGHSGHSAGHAAPCPLRRACLAVASRGAEGNHGLVERIRADSGTDLIPLFFSLPSDSRKLAFE